MLSEFRIALYLGGVVEFGAITKYTGWHVENLKICKPHALNFEHIVNAVNGFGYTLQRLWYRIPGCSLKDGLVEVKGDDKVIELMCLGLAYDVIDVYAEGSNASVTSSSTDGNSDEDNYKVESGSESEQDVGTLFLSDDDYILGGSNEEFFIAREIRKEAEFALATAGVAGVHNLENQDDNESENEDNVIEEYIACLSPFENDDYEEVSDQRKGRTIRYDPNCDHREIKFQVGMRFSSATQFKKAVQMYAIVNGFNVGWKSSSTRKMDVRCTDDCEWRVYGSCMTKEKTFMIKTVGNEHTCPRSMRNKNATYVWLAEQFSPKIRANLKYTTSQMQADAMELWGLILSKRTCYRAIARAIKIIRGPFIEQYKLLHSYRAELIRCSPNSIFDLEVGQQNTFKRFYVGFEALKKGFQAGCRRFIGLDGCFTKTIVKGMLLCAIGRDGNNQMFPIAWAVVEAETEESWTWFLELLLTDLHVGQGYGWTFMSDQQKGLLNALSKISPQAEHKNCARHIYANWKKFYKGDAFRSCFWRAVYSTYEVDFDTTMKEMKEESDDAYKDFMRQGPENFCRAFIKRGQNCDAIENNLSETFNAYICKEREYPIVDMLEGIRKLLMVRMYEKSQLMVNSRDIICPRIRAKIEDEKMKSRYCIPRPSTAFNFEVDIRDDRFVVDLNEKTCSCRQWDISGVPCSHAISCINYKKSNICDYVADCFKKDAYERCYQFALPTLNGRKMWPKPNEDPLLPPPFRKLPGRQKKNRKRDEGEKADTGKRKKIRKPRITNTDSSKMSRAGMTIKCSNCHGIGHNKTTCPQPPQSLEIPPARKRGRPRNVSKQPSTEVGTSSKQRTESNIIRAEKRRALQGYGVYVAEKTGNTYFSVPSMNLVREIRVDGQNQTKVSNEVCGPSQTQESHMRGRK